MNPLICPACGARTPRLPGSEVKCLRCRALIPAEHHTPPEGEGEAVTEGPTGPTPFPVERFQPVPGGAPAGVLVAVTVGVLGAIVLGAVGGVVRQFFWLVLIFPVLLGFGIGGAASAGAWLAKCRRTELAMGAGVVAGLVGALALHYTSYQIAISGLPPGVVSFQKYLELRCEAGVMGFGYTGTVIYFLVEVAAIVIAAGAGAIALINGPFCVKCDLWKQKEALGKFKINADVAAWAVGSGLPALAVAPPEGNETVQLELFRCPHCRDNGPIEVRATCTKTQGENSATAVVFVTYPGEAAAQFEDVRRACGG